MTKAQFKLNLPVELADEVRRAASAANRSMTAEMIHRIARPQTEPSVLETRIARLEGGAETLRDWFAGQALANVGSNWSDAETRNEYAKRLYQIADAMLAAREVAP